MTNIDMPTEAPDATRGTTGQLTDQFTQLFSDSMLAASKASSEAAITNNTNSKATREQTFTSVEVSMSAGVSDRRTVQARIPLLQTVLPQQFLQTPQAQMTNSAVTPLDLPRGGNIASPSSSIAGAGEAMGHDVAAPSTEDKSTSSQASMPKPSDVMSGQAWSGSDPLETQSKLAGARFQNKEVPVAHSSETRTGLANTSTAVASKKLEKNDRNASLSTASNGVQNSFPSAVLTPLLTADSLTVWKVAAQTPSITVSCAGQNTAQNAVLDAPSSTSLKSTSDAAPNAVQSMVANEAMGAMQDSFAEALVDGTSNAAPSAIQSTAQHVAANSVSKGVLYSFPKANLKSLSSAAPNVVTNGMLESLPSPDRNVVSNSASNAFQSVAANPATKGVLYSFPSATPKPPSSTAPDTSLDSAPQVIQSAAPNAVPDGMQDSLPNADLSGLPNEAPIIPSNGAPSALDSTVQNAAHNWLQNSFLKAVLNAFASAGPNVLSNAASNAPARVVPNNGPDAVPSAVRIAVPNSVQNATLDAVPNPASGALLGAEQLPVPHSVPAASSKEVAATPSDNVSPELTIPSATSPDQTTLAAALSVPETTVNQFVTLPQVKSGSLLEGEAGVLGVNPASTMRPSDVSVTNGQDGIKDISEDATGLKLHTSSASSPAKLQRDSQAATQSNDQGQNSSASQGQDSVRPEMNAANHAVAASAAAQTMVNPSPAQSSAMPASAPAHTAKTPDNALPASAAVAQALPVINTAKLIQSMGQTEMRVGMRSTEFGNISISTSSTRDLISAQISLDHGELARTLATHLPEIQARFANQPMDVRIDMNGASAGQTGTPGGTDNGSADPSRGGRQQAGNADSSFSGNHLGGLQLSPAAATLTTGDSGFNARLDIRV